MKPIPTFIFAIALFNCIRCNEFSLDDDVENDELSWKDSTDDQDVEKYGPRIRRATTVDFDTAIDRMQKMKRITTGIYLTQIFSSDNIKTDDFISQLLRLGTTTPSILKTMDLPSLQKALAAVMELDKKWTTSDMENEVENAYLVYAEIRKTTMDMGDLNKLEGKEDFVKEVEELKTFNFKQFTDLKTAIDQFQLGYSEIMKIDTNNIDDITKGSLGGYLKKLNTEATMLKTDSISTANFGDLDTFSKMFNPISKFTKAVELKDSNRDTITKVFPDDNAKNSVKANIANMGNIKSQLQSLKSNIESMMKLHDSVLGPPSVLLDGPSDFNKMFADLSDPWIKDVFERTEPLAKALGDLTSIGSASTTSQSFLSALTSSTRTVLKKTIRIGESIPESADQIESLSQILGCSLFDMGKPGNTDKVELLIRTINELKSKVDKLKTLKSLSSDFSVQNMNLLDETIRLTTLPATNPLEEVHKMVKALKDSTDFGKLLTNLKTFSTSFDVIDDLKKNPIKDSAEKVLNELPELDSWQKEAAQKVSGLGCLHNVKDAENIPTLINILREFRKNKDKPFEKSVDVIGNVIKAVEEMQKIEDAVKLKGKSNKDLEAFAQTGEDTKGFGLATHGLVSIKRAIDAKDATKLVKDHLQLVETEAQNAKGLASEDANNLKQLTELNKELQAINLDQWKVLQSTVNDSKNLEDYSLLYEQANGITGISVDLNLLHNSLENLEDRVTNPSTKTKLSKLLEAIEQLKSIDLKFSKFNTALTGAKNSMHNLDLAFVDYRKRMAPPVTSIVKPVVNGKPAEPEQQVQNVTTALLETSTIPKEDGIGILAWIGIIFLVILVIGVIAAAIVWCCCCMEKKKGKSVADINEKEKLIVKPSTSATNGTETAVTNEPVVNKEEGNKEDEKKEEEKKEDVKKEEDAGVVKQPVRVITDLALPAGAGEAILRNLYEKMRSIPGPDGPVRDGEQQLGNYSDVLLQALDTTVPKKNDPIIEGHQLQNRVQISVTPATEVHLRSFFFDRLKIPGNYLNANCQEMPNGVRVFMTQNPMMDTQDKFFCMLTQTGTKAIVMLGPENKFERETHGIGGYCPDEPNKGVTLRSGTRFRLAVRCVEKKIIHPGLIHRKLLFKCVPKLRDNGNFVYLEDFLPPLTEEVPPTEASSKGAKKTTEASSKGAKEATDASSKGAKEATEASSKGAKEESKAVSKPSKEESKEVPKPSKESTEEKPKALTKAQQERKEKIAEARLLDDKIPSGDVYMDADFDYKFIYEFEVDHWQITDWPADSMPCDATEIKRVWKEIRNVRNVVVHCSDGVGRSGAFANCEYGRQYLCQRLTNNINADIDFLHILAETRRCRNAAIYNDKQIACVLLTLVEMGYENGNRNARHHLTKYNNFVSMYHNMRNPENGIVEPLKTDVTEAFEGTIDEPEKKSAAPKAQRPKRVETVVNELELDKTQETIRSTKSKNSSNKSNKSKSMKEDKTQEF